MYEERNAALRRNLKAHGASLNRQVSEIEGVRQLLNQAEERSAHERQKAEERLAHERQLRHVLEQMHAKLGTHFNIVKSPIKKKN